MGYPAEQTTAGGIATRADSTPAAVNHANDHNAVRDAWASLMAVLGGSGIQGASATLLARLAAIEASEAANAANIATNTSAIAAKAPSARLVSTGAGLSGGGDLSADRTLAVDATVVRTTRTVTAGTGLTGGGDLSANRTLAIDTTVTAQIIEAVNNAGNSGAAQTVPDVAAATAHRYTLTANCTFTFPAAAAGKAFTLALTQDATGSRTAVWPGTVKWTAGTAPTLTATATKTDLLSFFCLDGANWFGVVSGTNF